MALGSLDLAGIGWCHPIEADPGVDVLARLSVAILLFEVGLSTVRDMLKVGLPSVLVAILGVVACSGRCCSGSGSHHVCSTWRRVSVGAACC